MPGALCSKRRRDSPFTRSNINWLLRARAAARSPHGPCPIGDPGVCHYTRLRLGRRYARNRPKQAPVDLHMSDVVRLEYRNVTMRFAETGGRGVLTAVQGVSFSVRDGEVVSLIGPSGCGKSTLLNIGSGLSTPERRQRLCRRRARRRAECPSRLHAAEGFAAAVAHRRRERHVRRRDPGRAGRRAPAARAGAAGKFQSRGIFRSLSASTVRRHAPARGAWRARSPSIRTCCCSTSRSPRWTRRPGWCCSAIWRRRSSRRARRRSSSPTIWPKR